MSQARRQNLWFVPLATLAAVVVIGYTAQSADGQTAIGDDPPFALLLEPIEGLTTGRHVVPEQITVPKGTLLRFCHPLPKRKLGNLTQTGTVTWAGAEEFQRTDSMSFAQCPMNDTGTFTIRALVEGPDGQRWERSCECTVLDFPARRIRVQDATASVRPVLLDEDATNEQTMEYFFGESVAELRRIEPARGLRDIRTGRTKRIDRTTPRYVTSVDRTITARIDVWPPEFASVIEWRGDGQARTLGHWVELHFGSVGEHRLTVGPPERQRTIDFEIYEVRITNHVNNVDIIPRGVPVTFQAVTNPPGYEQYITWLSSTKYGTAVPLIGSGSRFTTTFSDTLGQDPDLGPFQWLGVRADNAVVNEDTGACCVESETRCYNGVTRAACKSLLAGTYLGDFATCTAEGCGEAADMYCKYAVINVVLNNINCGGCPIQVGMNATAFNKTCSVLTDCPAEQQITVTCNDGVNTCTTTEDRKACD